MATTGKVSNRPIVTRTGDRFITVAAQRDAGVRVDIQHPIKGGQELHLEFYDWNGRPISLIPVNRGKGHPELVVRIHEIGKPEAGND